MTYNQTEIGAVSQYIRQQSTLVNPNNSSTVSSTRSTLQLCYLQISQALPTALNYALYFIYIVNYSDITIGYSAISGGLTFEEAMQNLNSSYGEWYIRIFLNLSNNLAHCYHFYLYMAFSHRFRNAFMRKVRRKGGQAGKEGSVMPMPTANPTLR